jgi:DNA-binding FadR family transcriptional regulator
MAQIEQRMSDGRLRPGDRLPSERDFATLLGVSRPSLRETLRVLEALGIVEVRPGGGADGGAVLSDSPGAGFVTLLRLQLALGHFSQADVLATRLALESWSCSEAATCRSDEDLRDLSLILDEMDSPLIAANDFNRLDAAFHVRIAEASGNALTAHLMRSLRTAINRQMMDAYARLNDWRETARSVRKEHREILTAIEAGDANGAALLVREHIESFYRDNGMTATTPVG